jgi:hypothetical protein
MGKAAAVCHGRPPSPSRKNPIDKRRDFENIATMIKSTHIAATYFWLFR